MLTTTSFTVGATRGALEGDAPLPPSPPPAPSPEEKSWDIQYNKADSAQEQNGSFLSLQGVFFPNKISDVGTIFGLVHVLPGPKKQRRFEPSILLS